MSDKFEIAIKDAVLNSSMHKHKQQQSWMAIDRRLREHKQKKRFLFLGIAASLLITICLGSVLLLQNTSLSKKNQSITNYEIKETEYYYANLIDLKYQQIAETANINKEYFQLFFNQMNELDIEYQTYLKDAKEFGFQESITRAMINNQQRRLKVLNKLLHEINKVKDYENIKISI